ncbi:MAG TPA: ribbon-helix-helix domain-containing protein [Gaiellaceae bacterium]|jgi:Arc/MetJ-type ribon-helix-helix transcriptional regulator
MSQQIAIRLPEEDLSRLDRAIARGRFPNRAAALRQALERLLRDEREREIEEAYRRGYGEQPQEEWPGEVGLAALAELVAAEEKDADPL